MTAVTSSTPLLTLKLVVLDTETTGLDASKARILQLGAVRVRDGRVADEALDVLVNPGEPIPSVTTAVHGIADHDVANAPKFAGIAETLEAFIEAAVILGHTVTYDLDVLKREYALAGRSWPAWRALDVRTLARLAAPSLADYNLDRLCEWLEVQNSRRHNALADAQATAAVYVKLLPLLRAKGIRTLGEAERASLALAEAEARAAGGLIALPEAGTTDAGVVARIDSYPYRHRVREIMSSPPVIVDGGTRLADALSMLLQLRISSVLVRIDDAVAGILTERDVLRAIEGRGPDALQDPVERYASRPLQVVDAEAFVYRAIGRIERLGLRHLGVRGPSGEVVGVVTTRNLLRHRATSTIVLGDEIEAAQDAAGLATAWSKTPAMVRSLLDEGVDPLIICAIVSSEIRNMTRRAAQLAERRMTAEGYGAPPLPYAVLVLGSAGRGESQLAADQDNALVFGDGAKDGAADAYFERLATVMSDLLDAAGIPYCKGGVMAKSQAWRMSLTDWKARIDGWVSRHRPDDLLNVDIFFDAVGVHGDTTLSQEIWNHAFDRGQRAVDFIKLLTEVARHRGQPLTLLGRFRTDEKGRMDVKKLALMPIFTAARVLAIRHDCRTRSTRDRLEAVAAKGIGSEAIMLSIIEAQHVLLGAVLRQQLSDLDDGVPLSPTIVPSRLDKQGRARLKLALKAADEAVGLASEGLW